jgi:hypothetical protein
MVKDIEIYDFSTPKIVSKNLPLCSNCKKYYSSEFSKFCSFCEKICDPKNVPMYGSQPLHIKYIIDEIIKKKYTQFFSEYILDNNLPYRIPDSTLFKHTLFSCVDQSPEMVIAMLNGLTEDNMHPLMLTSMQASELFKVIYQNKTTYNNEIKYDHDICFRVVDFWNVPSYAKTPYLCYFEDNEHGLLNLEKVHNRWKKINNALSYCDLTININKCNICYENVCLFDIVKCMYCSFVCHYSCLRITEKCYQCRRNICFEIIDSYYII